LSFSSIIHSTAYCIFRYLFAYSDNSISATHYVPPPFPSFTQNPRQSEALKANKGTDWATLEEKKMGAASRLATPSGKGSVLICAWRCETESFCSPINPHLMASGPKVELLPRQLHHKYWEFYLVG